MTDLQPKDTLNIALVQTTLDHDVAWPKTGTVGPLPRLEAERAWEEIREGFHTIATTAPKAQAVLLPELAVPRWARQDLIALARATSTLVIAGCDYQIDNQAHTIANRGLIIVPDAWPTSRASRRTTSFSFGKTYPAPAEEDCFRKNGYTFIPDPTIWVLETQEYGRLGVCICYDFMDIERISVYATSSEIHHLFVLAYNKDTDLFLQLAGTSSRTVFCNVVVCNTGYYGGSVAVAPYNERHERIIYRHDGAQLFNVQVITLPVKSLIEASKTPRRDRTGEARRFKDLPPGRHHSFGHQIQVIPETQQTERA